MVNLIATLPGRRPDRIIIATHYDTKIFRQFRFVGASDGASSTAVGAGTGARAQGDAAHEFTIEFLFLDGEEAVVEWAGERPHLRQPLLRRQRAADADAGGHQSR